jgi:sialate O-acetylesterase
MVLQRDSECPIWGWAEAGQKVTVGMVGKPAEATADAAGKWMVRLGPFPAGGPHEMTIRRPETVTLRNVLLGDVWICSGQSNMQFGVGGVDNAAQEIAATDHPRMRLFTVPNVTALEPQATVSGQWLPCTPQTIGGFTAVGYFFGRTFLQELDVPIGLINSSWGGTIAEAWTSGKALKKGVPDFVPAVEAIEKLAADQQAGIVDFENQMAEWYPKNDPGSAEARGCSGRS